MIIKDEIYGTISFSETEKRIIDTSDFQRLRRIKQMSLTYLVYPGATHTRFDHALGTMHLASAIAEKLKVEGEELRLYALLHDVGHVAFSHDSEKVLKKYLGNHEEIGKKKVCNGVIADIINENYSAKKIWAIGEQEIGKIVTSDIGADRMDYLKRDSHNTGVAYGVIDVDRLLHTLSMEKGELCVDQKGLEAAETLLISRFMMFSTVYLHKTTRVAAAMFCRALQAAIENNEIDPEEFLEMTDEEALMRLKKTSSEKLIRRLTERRLYKIVEQFDPAEKKVKVAKDCFVDQPIEQREINIKIKTKEGLLIPIKEISTLVRSLIISERERMKCLIIKIDG